MKLFIFYKVQKPLAEDQNRLGKWIPREHAGVFKISRAAAIVFTHFHYEAIFLRPKRSDPTLLLLHY